ncbi:hypothetical protein SAMN05421810_1018 [Amycolatopsis arida]|uniref:Secreted protein n=1 Tax=Amycolatopsis arida TaxID=587909 RepID=A0A1I5K606_9PSEU|nr:hypothetical protein CLV69_1026 [Amycolatopsis arida]SFO80544.1 hypothetical protein SAMN05421810_1018 [Amycolatopsis arida]
MKKRLRRIGVCLAAGVALLIAASPAWATAGEFRSESEAIEEFVDRIHERFGLVVDGSDYETRNHGQAVYIVRKGAPVTATRSTELGHRASGDQPRLEKSFSPGLSSPPTPTEAKIQVDQGEVTVQQGIAWYQPECWSNNNPPLTDPKDAGWMDACWQWGDMNYSGASRANFAFRMYATCKPGEADYYELKECYVDSVRHSTSAPLVWNDWSPKSTVDLGGCGQVQLQVGVGPVTGGATVSTCEELIPEREVDPADMRTRWVGDAYWKDEVRETGQIVSIGVAYGAQAVIQPSFGYFYAECSWAGFPWCG